MLAAVTGTLLLASGCGGDGGGVEPEPNEAPVANFTVPASGCTVNVACTFTDASTDDAGVTAWSWDFDGNGTPDATTQSPSHTFTTAQAFNVTLTVTDAEGLTGTKTTVVTVAPVAPPVNTPPTASFDLSSCTAGTPCGFHSTSTDPDADGSIASTHWEFGDAGVADGPDATHTYAAAGTFTVTLTVTDNLGGIGTATEQLIVAPAASEDCTTSGTVVDCTLTVTQRSTVKFIMMSEACQLTGNRLTVQAPLQQTVFFNVCNRLPGEEYTVRDAGGAPLVLEAGASLTVRFSQGTPGEGDPPTGDPGIQVDNGFPNWTLRIDDGGNAGVAGEPDFDDAVVRVQATLAP
jgi:PKD repeat protein